MIIASNQTNERILLELGTRLAQRRIDLQLTQADLAHQAGLSKRTVERIEAGESTQMTNLVRIFRILELLPNLDHLIPEAGTRPMELLKLKGKTRRRASPKRQKKSNEIWTWKE